MTTQAHNTLAWVLATSADEKCRNGAKAVTHARQAFERTEWKDAGIIDTLAAALAESGEFESAAKWQRTANEKASDKDRPGMLERLKLYNQRKPYREK
jgi:hypothetical protein